MPLPVQAAAVLDLFQQWNEDYAAEYELIDDLTGTPLDLTGCTISMQVRRAPGVTGDPLLSATCVIVGDPANGKWSETIGRAVIKTATGGPDTVSWAYDVLITDAAGLRKIWRRGAFVVAPGVNP